MKIGTSVSVEDIREAFLAEIRPKGIRWFATLVEDISCSATLASGIPRRDSPKGHSLVRNISRRHQLLRNIRLRHS